MKSLSVPWAVLMFSISALIAWSFLDPQFDRWLVFIKALPQHSWDDLQWFIETVDAKRSIGCVAIVALVLASIAWMTVRSVQCRKPKGSRSSILPLLQLSTACAITFGTVMQLDTIAVHGRSLNHQSNVAAYEKLRSQIRDPGDLPSTIEETPYNAYPFERPSVLIFLGAVRPDGCSVEFNTIQYSENGSMRFKLSGSTFDDWLEWHPDRSAPRSFLGGLDDQHNLLHSAQLSQGWHFVRYRV